MSGFAFDANIIIDALTGYPQALQELERAVDLEGRPWISRMAWIEVLSKGTTLELRRGEKFMSTFHMEEIDVPIARQAAALRRERARLRSPDAIILASAMVRGRILVTRNTKDFPPNMPGIRIPYTL